MPQGTITGKIKRPILKASRGPALLEHIRAANSWDPTTLDLVDWDSHGVVLRNIPHEVTMIKIIHGLLPVGARTSKYHPKYRVTSAPLARLPLRLRYIFTAGPLPAAGNGKANLSQPFV